jgi:conjugal transfer pilus assembly protein TrbC
MRDILINCCLVASFLSLPGFCQTTIHQSWFNKIENREKEFDQVHKQLIEELQKQEQKEVEQVKKVMTSQCGTKQQSACASLKEQCLNCSSDDWTIFQDPQVLVFMSFSIPDHAWISLSQELEKMGGAFVLRGLPNQSFQALACKILKLKEQGVNAPIQLDPKSFLKFEINQVPAIVVVEKQIFDKISGHVSLKFALEKMAEHGETKIAKTLYQTLKGQI